MVVSDLRALDHFVIVSHHLDKSGQAWEALGFRVLPKMKHLTAGSANRVIQLRQTYIELLGDLDTMIEPYREHYQARLDLGEGLANICFSSTDLAGDRAAVEASGMRAGPVTSARRPVIMPDGSTQETDSDFFYTWRADRPYMSPFLAEHRRPDCIFVPAYQNHPNTAAQVVGVTCLSLNPAADAAAFSILSGGSIETDGVGKAKLHLGDNGWVEFLAADALDAHHAPDLPALDVRSGGYAVGLTISVTSLDRCGEVMGTGIAWRNDGSSIIVPASAVTGCFVRFVQDETR